MRASPLLTDNGRVQAAARHVQPFKHTSTAYRRPRWPRRTGRRHAQLCVARNMEISVVGDEGMPPLKQVFNISENSKLFTASLTKPLGLTLAEQNGKIVVETVAEEGNGSRAGIKVGDIVQGTTARSKNTRQESVTSVEARNKQSFLGGLVLLNADGEDFDTIIAAIQSSKCSGCDVTLVLERSGSS